MNCKNFEFNPNYCDLNCPKYPMCSHGYIEHQLSEIQSQIGTIYSAITKLVITEKMNEENIEKVVALFNDYFQDSELKNKNEWSQNEKDN